MPYEKIVLSGKGYISTEALKMLSENNRNVILLDTFGKPITYMNPARESMTFSEYRIAQYDTFRNPEKRNYSLTMKLKQEFVISVKKMVGHKSHEAQLFTM